MDFEIESLIGVGSIKFGMTREKVHQVMSGNHVEDFKRSTDSISDYYINIGLFVYYDKDDMVEALEFHEPANVILYGAHLLSLKALDAYNLIFSLDNSAIIDDDGLISFSLGIGFYAPNYQDDNTLSVESVIVFKQGYYD